MVNCLCTYCKYEWQPRVKEPKACPRCKNRLDYYKTRVVDIRQILKES